MVLNSSLTIRRGEWIKAGSAIRAWPWELVLCSDLVVEIRGKGDGDSDYVDWVKRLGRQVERSSLTPPFAIECLTSVALDGSAAERGRFALDALASQYLRRAGERRVERGVWWRKGWCEHLAGGLCTGVVEPETVRNVWQYNAASEASAGDVRGEGGGGGRCWSEGGVLWSVF